MGTVLQREKMEMDMMNMFNLCYAYVLYFHGKEEVSDCEAIELWKRQISSTGKTVCKDCLNNLRDEHWRNVHLKTAAWKRAINCEANKYL